MGNPPDSDVLGLILPRASAAWATRNPWAVVVTYSDDGYVSDEEGGQDRLHQAAQDMQAGTRGEPGAQRRPATRRWNWWAGRAPRYDAPAATSCTGPGTVLEGSPTPELRYPRAGPQGYLSLNAVSGTSQPRCRKACSVLGMTTEFDRGHRYADFNQATDKVAATASPPWRRPRRCQGRPVRQAAGCCWRPKTGVHGHCRDWRRDRQAVQAQGLRSTGGQPGVRRQTRAFAEVRRTHVSWNGTVPRPRHARRRSPPESAVRRLR